MNFGHVIIEVSKTLGSWLIVAGAFHLTRFLLDDARNNSKNRDLRRWNSKKGRSLAYFYSIVITALLAYGLRATYGTHVEDDDPLRGGGGEVVVDFEPTEQERNEHGLKYLLVLGIPSILAIHLNYKKKPAETPEA
jgi:hypothetical protein